MRILPKVSGTKIFPYIEKIAKKPIRLWPAGVFELVPEVICGVLCDGNTRIEDRFQHLYYGIFRYPQLLERLAIATPEALEMINDQLEQNHIFRQNLLNTLSNKGIINFEEFRHLVNKSPEFRGRMLKIKDIENSKYFSMWLFEEEGLYLVAEKKIAGTGLPAEARFKMFGIQSFGLRDLNQDELKDAIKAIKQANNNGIRIKYVHVENHQIKILDINNACVETLRRKMPLRPV